MQGISKLIAGDSLDFTTEVAGYPATDGWTLKYRLVPRFSTPTQAPIELTAATYQTTGYRVQQGPSETEGWAAGAYSWSSWVEQSGQRVTLEQGRELTIAADPATTAQGYDVRTSAQVRLAAVRAAIAALVSSNVKSYTINGRSVTRNDLPELRVEEQRCIQDVKRENAAAAMAAGQSGRKQVFVRLGRA